MSSTTLVEVMLIVVDKTEAMLGSYGPQANAYEKIVSALSRVSLGPSVSTITIAAKPPLYHSLWYPRPLTAHCPAS